MDLIVTQVIKELCKEIDSLKSSLEVEKWGRANDEKLYKEKIRDLEERLKQWEIVNENS